MNTKSSYILAAGLVVSAAILSMGLTRVAEAIQGKDSFNLRGGLEMKVEGGYSPVRTALQPDPRAAH
jgi:hypothetical protein